MPALVLAMSRVVPEIYDAARAVAFHRPLHSGAFGCGALVPALVIATCWTGGPPQHAATAIAALIWGAAAFHFYLIAGAVCISRLGRERTVVLDSDGLVFASSRARRPRAWSDVIVVIHVPGAIAIRCHHEQFFVASLATLRSADRRRLNRLLTECAPRVLKLVPT